MNRRNFLAAGVAATVTAMTSKFLKAEVEDVLNATKDTFKIESVAYFGRGGDDVVGRICAIRLISDKRRYVYLNREMASGRKVMWSGYSVPEGLKNEFYLRIDSSDEWHLYEAPVGAPMRSCGIVDKGNYKDAFWRDAHGTLRFDEGESKYPEEIRKAT